MFLVCLSKVIKDLKNSMGRFVTNHGTFSSSLLFWGLISFFTSLYALT
ncbi:hypothetical protein HMPREF9441_01534 [Paraprevotella clara YIT 11840]|uniref:Uncharacterized protein n=1 Tax=Paraprevotella clara YIT 11840 TaxID=762968 RepID=G5SQ96_9BACT|nr:hypothetical protein HMPREF9441_01534 [Paraprevotella clara YIT 11840]